MEIYPFECPICFESYSAVNVPTTLPCGHSCCIIHAGSLSQCFACRMDIGDARSLRPSYALRDGSILFFSLCDNPEIMTGEKFSRDLKQDHRECDSSSSPLPKSKPLSAIPPPVPISNVASNQSKLCPNAVCESFKSQTKSAKHLVDCSHAPSRSNLFHCRRCSTGFKTQKKLDAHTSSCPYRNLQPPNDKDLARLLGWRIDDTPTATPPTTSQFTSHCSIKGCGHRCSPSSLPACCRCMDRRPMQAEGTYPRYVDGEGWKNIGLRREGYCPNCK
jgi:hypothetical protein